LLSVNVLAALFVPTVVDGKLAVAGVNVTGASPVPDSVTFCGLLEALSLIESVPVRDPAAVGVKTTPIWQVFPPANVAPQGVLPVAVLVAKSPAVTRLVMSSVTLPPLVSVTFFAALVAPTTVVENVRAVGATLTPVASGFTVRLNVVALVKLPDTPLTVTETVPGVAEALAIRVSVLAEVVGFGANCAVTPLGRVELDSVTLPLKPPPSVTVMVVVPVPP
jgi:hypothetical protein